MKKLLAILLVLCMVIPAAALGEEVVKIGVYEPATGDSGAGGKQEMLGMQYANELFPTVKIGDTEYKVELVYADNGSSSDKAPSAAQKLVSENVSVVLGSYGSSVSNAGKPYFGEAGIPAIGVTCTNPSVTAGNTHYFRICFLDPFQGTVLANYATEKLGATIAYCLGELGNDYDTGLIYNFKQAFEKNDGMVVDEYFQTGNTDFTSYLTNASMYGAQVIFAPCSLAYAALICSAAGAQGVTTPILGSDTWDSNVVVDAAAGQNITIYVSTFYQEGGSPEFDAGFKAWINSDSVHLANNNGNDMISAVSAMGYDAYMVALEALKAAGSKDPKAVNAALWDVKYDGVTGAIAFDETGDAIRDVAFIKHLDTANSAWELAAVQGKD